jgi:hypothetical protein
MPYRNPSDTIEQYRNPTVHPVTGVEPIKAANLPADTTFTGTVAKTIYSEYNRPGDPVMLILDHALMGSDNSVVAPAGSRVLGTVISVLPANTSNDKAELGIRFHEIIRPDGQRLSIDAGVNNADGILRADTPESVVFSGNRSTKALQNEIAASEGGLFGTKQGKMYVLDTPLTRLGSDRPLAYTDRPARTDVVLAVGDKLQVRVGPAPSGMNTGSQTGTY